MSFEGFIIGEQNQEGFSDINCIKCDTTLSTITKHIDIVKTLRCGNCGYKSIRSDRKRIIVVSKQREDVS